MQPFATISKKVIFAFEIKVTNRQTAVPPVVAASERVNIALLQDYAVLLLPRLLLFFTFSLG